jgi:hypothetical protein
MQAFPMSLRTANRVGQRVLAFNEIGNPKPSLGQLVPYGLIFSTVCDFGHGLALSGKSQEAFGRVHCDSWR